MVCTCIHESADWNAHLLDVHPRAEDPEPENGVPRPLLGPEQTAEHIYYQQLAAWHQINNAPIQQQQYHGHNLHHPIDEHNFLVIIR